MSKKAGVCLLAITLLLAGACVVSAQTTTTLYGTVTDKSGAIVPGAQVTATNVGTNQSRTAQTGTEGEYRFDFMPVGAYTVEVTATGFQEIRAEERHPGRST